MTKFYVYEHWRLDRDECFYVGKGTGRRAYQSRSRNMHHRAITAKLLREGHAWEVRFVATNLTDEEACNIEKDRISFWKSLNIDLANITAGGTGGNTRTSKTLTEEHKRKISEAHKGKPKGKMSLEARKNLSLARMGNKNRLGIPTSDEVKMKLSLALKGKKKPRKAKVNQDGI